jgi:hypothetical protein
MHPIRLSKTRLMKGYSCEKNLYLTVHSPQLEAPVDAAREAVFEQGRRVGIEAQKEFPFGLLIDEPFHRTAQAIEKTAQALRQGELVLFEAAFEHQSFTAKVDILLRTHPDSAWEIREVKSTTKVKPEHLVDAAIQLFIVRGSGVAVNKVQIQVLNSECTAPRLENLFRLEDVTAAVEALQSDIPGRLAQLLNVVEQPTAPRTDIGPHCTAPYECGFLNVCWKHIPQMSVFDFPDLKKKVWEFYSQGIVDPLDERFGPFEAVQAHRLHAVRTGKRWVDASAIANALAHWRWPLVHLDFETIAYAIPKYEGTHVYEQTAFQFAANVQNEPGALAKEFDFLHEQDSDPRVAIIEPLCEVLCKGRSIVAYSKSFEARQLQTLAEYADRKGMAKAIQSTLLGAVDRLVDPLPIFKSAVYDAAFGGSFSLKAVAPAILGTTASYSAMAIADGGAAQRAFVEMTDPNTSPKRKAELRAALKFYCRKDTDLMQHLVDWLMQFR